MGFFGSISRGWSFIKEAFSMALRERSLLKPTVYLVVSSIVYFVIWAVVMVGTGVDFETSQGKILAAVMTFGSFLIFYFFCGMTVNMIDVYLKGGKPRVGEAFKDACQNFVAIGFLALISTIVELLAKAARRRGRQEGGAAIVVAVLAGIIEAIWTVVSFLLLPAIIIEDLSLGAALRRVRDLHKRNLLLIAIGEVGVRLITGLIGFAVMIVIALLVYVSFAVLGGGTAGIILAVIVGGTLLSLLAAFNVFVRMAYYTCLYLWAVEVERVGQEAPAPAPLAAALGRA